jgi:hypothetical protein
MSFFNCSIAVILGIAMVKRFTLLSGSRYWYHIFNLACLITGRSDTGFELPTQRCCKTLSNMLPASPQGIGNGKVSILLRKTAGSFSAHTAGKWQPPCDNLFFTHLCEQHPSCYPIGSHWSNNMTVCDRNFNALRSANRKSKWSWILPFFSLLISLFKQWLLFPASEWR